MLARYAFDVDDWNNLWAVFHGVSGRRGRPHHADENPGWSACLAAPMHYTWPLIEREARTTQTLLPPS